MGMVGIIRCRGHRWSDPLLDHQTVRGGPKGAVGCYVHQGRRDTRCEGLRGWVGRKVLIGWWCGRESGRVGGD